MFGFEVITVVTMKSVVFWIVTGDSSEKAQRFRGTYHFHLQCKPSKKPAELGGNCHLLVLVPNLVYSLTLKMKVMCSSRTSVFLQTSSFHKPEGCDENLKSHNIWNAYYGEM
jgi:hypothetical protein